MAFLTGGLNFTTSGLLLLAIVLAKHQHASPTIIGLMFALASVGGIIGSLFGPWVQRRFSFGPAVIVLVWIQVLVFPLFAIAPNPFLLGAVGAGLFVCGPAFNVVVVSYRLALIPDELQGRVNSAYRLLAFGFQPLGVGATGLSIQRFGAVTTVLLFSIVLGALGVLTTANRHVRHAPPIAEAHVA
jgi:predicted MFS family arabinose efflux permease